MQMAHRFEFLYEAQRQTVQKTLSPEVKAIFCRSLFALCPDYKELHFLLFLPGLYPGKKVFSASNTKIRLKINTMYSLYFYIYKVVFLN